MIEKLGSERMHQREGIVMCYPYQVLNTGNDINVNLRPRIWDNLLEIFQNKRKRFYIFWENIITIQ